MINKSVLTIILAIIMISGCGGGSGNPITPAPKDLSGLEGAWTGSISITGSIDFPAYGNFYAESFPVAQTRPVEWHFTKNTITKSDGGEYIWTYDGKLLTLKYSCTEQIEDETGECNTINISDVVVMTIPLEPTSTSGIVTGSIEETWTTESCGTGYGVLEVNGNIHR